MYNSDYDTALTLELPLWLRDDIQGDDIAGEGKTTTTYGANMRFNLMTGASEKAITEKAVHLMQCGNFY